MIFVSYGFEESVTYLDVFLEHNKEVNCRPNKRSRGFVMGEEEFDYLLVGVKCNFCPAPLHRCVDLVDRTILRVHSGQKNQVWWYRRSSPRRKVKLYPSKRASPCK